MKIAILIADISKNAGGLYHSVRATAKGLYLLGHEVVVFSFGHYPDEVMKAWSPVSVNLSAWIGPNQYKYSREYYDRIVHFGPQIIHSHGLWLYTSYTAYRLKKNHGIPIVLSPRGMLDSWALKNSRIKKSIMWNLQEKKFLKSVTRFHALSDFEKKSILNLFPEALVSVVPNGIHIKSDFNQVTSVKEKKILFLSRIHPKKGIKNLILAWNKLKELVPNEFSRWRLIIAGWDDGNHLFEYENLKKNLNLMNVDFVGPVYGEEKYKLMRESSAFILPSFSEGLPMAVLEACSVSTPVLISRQCNLPEVYRSAAGLDTGTGVDSIASSLCEFIGMEESDRDEMGKKGRALVCEQFNWVQIVGKISLLYSEILK